MLKSKVKRFSRKKVFEGYCFDVVVDEVHWPNDKRKLRDLILHPGISVMVPQLDKDHLILLRQYRYGADQILWEIPAGTIQEEETALDCAKREIEEEIGYRAGRWKKLTSCFASPGFNTEMIHCFLAQNLHKTQARLGDDEILETKVVPIQEVEKMILKKKIQDSKSLVALFYFFALRKNHEC